MTIPLDSEFLRGLDSGAAARLLALRSPIDLPAGSVLFALGSEADRLFLIEGGRIALTLPMQYEGRDLDLVVEEKGVGEMVGWSALIPPHRFTLKAAAPVNATLLAIPRAALLEEFAAHPEVAHAVTRNIAAVVGQRLQVFQAMWLRQMQRLLELRVA